MPSHWRDVFLEQVHRVRYLKPLLAFPFSCDIKSEMRQHDEMVLITYKSMSHCLLIDSLFILYGDLVFFLPSLSLETMSTEISNQAFMTDLL